MNAEVPYRSFSAGDLVLSCYPWVWALASRDEYSRYCAFRFTERPDLRTCSRCKLHRYCDAQCQMADWKQEHKRECMVLCTRLGSVDTITNAVDFRGLMALIFMSKIALKLVRNTQYNIDGLGMKTAREVLDSLPTYPDNEKLESFFEFNMFENINPEQLFPAFNPFCSMRHFTNFLKLIEHNAFPIRDPRTKENLIGIALVPQAPFRAMMPVCWDSNVMLDFRGRKFVIHTTEDIAQYTELNDLRYSELLGDPSFLTPAERRQLFQEIYKRPCDCRKCTSAYEAEINPLKCVTPGCTERIPSDERALVPCPQCGAISKPERLQQVKGFVNQLERIRTLARVEGAVEEAQYAAETELREKIDTLGILHADAHIRFLVGWHGIDKYRSEGRLAEAWELSKAMINCVREIIPRYHYRRAILLLEGELCLGEFVRKLRNMEKVADTQQEARQLLTDLFGNSTATFELCREAWEIYRKIYGEDSKRTRDARDCYMFVEGVKRDLRETVRRNWNVHVPKHCDKVD